MPKIRHTRSFLIRRPWVLISAAVFVAAVMWAIGTRQHDHHVRAAFQNAVSIVPGLAIRYEGLVVGKVSSVSYQDGEAIVGMGIDSGPAWPLHRGTVAVLRWGTTVGNGTRFVELRAGPASAPKIPDGGIIGVQDTVTPVEFDQIFNTFDAPTRANMRAMLAHTGDTLAGHAGTLNAGLHRAPPALASAAGVMQDLASDQSALTGTILNGHRVMQVLAGRQAQISDLVTVAAATFDEFAAHSRDVQSSIEGMHPTFQQARATLARLDTSLGGLSALVADLRPGAAQLRPLAAEARPALVQLRHTVPVALATVRTAEASAPAVTTMLANGVPFAGDLGNVLSRLGPMLSCVRPYAPELAGFLSNWASWAQDYDAITHYGRVRVIEGPHSGTFAQGVSTAQFVNATGSLYALPRPPGVAAGQPWLIPSCGYGPAALDPARDPESHP
jgi:virulence factor Mce-like protein